MSTRADRLQAALEAQVAGGAPGALAYLGGRGAGGTWTGSAGELARAGGRALRPDDAFRAASVTKHVTAALAVRLAAEGRIALDEPLSRQLPPDLLHRWRAMNSLPHTTPRQMISHTAGLPDYFGDEAFFARVREDPRRPWLPVELVDHAPEYGTPTFLPGEGFQYSDTGFVIAGILIEQAMGRPLHDVYREVVFD